MLRGTARGAEERDRVPVAAGFTLQAEGGESLTAARGELGSLAAVTIDEPNPVVAVQGDLSAFHDVAAAAHFQRELGVLLDQQDGHALPGDGEDGLEDFLHHQGRKPHRGLVEEQQLGAGHQRAAHRQHLLFAAGERSCCLLVPLLEPRKQTEHALDVIADRRAIAAGVRAHRQVFLDGERAKNSATFRDHGQALADELERGLAGDVFVGVADGSRLDRLQAGDALERCRLACAVCADQADELALRDGEIDALDRLNAAVGDLQALELEERRCDRHLAAFTSSVTSPPRYAAITVGSFCTTAAVPSAIFLP